MIVDTGSHEVNVSNIPSTVSQRDLERIFGEFGDENKPPTVHYTRAHLGAMTGTALITYDHAIVACMAARRVDGRTDRSSLINGHPLTVVQAIPPPAPPLPAAFLRELQQVPANRFPPPAALMESNLSRLQRQLGPTQIPTPLGPPRANRVYSHDIRAMTPEDAPRSASCIVTVGNLGPHVTKRDFEREWNIRGRRVTVFEYPIAGVLGSARLMYETAEDARHAAEYWHGARWPLRDSDLLEVRQH